MTTPETPRIEISSVEHDGVAYTIEPPAQVPERTPADLFTVFGHLMVQQYGQLTELKPELKGINKQALRRLGFDEAYDFISGEESAVIYGDQWRDRLVTDNDRFTPDWCAKYLTGILEGLAVISVASPAEPKD